MNRHDTAVRVLKLLLDIERDVYRETRFAVGSAASYHQWERGMCWEQETKLRRLKGDANSGFSFVHGAPTRLRETRSTTFCAELLLLRFRSDYKCAGVILRNSSSSIMQLRMTAHSGACKHSIIADDRIHKITFRQCAGKFKGERTRR